MTTYTKCPPEVNSMALDLLCRFQTHQPLLDAKVKIDFVFAMPEIDEKTGNPKSDALKKNGLRALGLCRAMPLKDRSMGRADAEITIDQYWWESAIEPEQMALLDHELHHIDLKLEHGKPVLDDLGRPVLKMRPHDFEVGWFAVIAARHGINSQERKQAQKAITDLGQYFWPELFAPSETSAPLETETVPTSDSELIVKCIDVIYAEQKASVSLLQRRLRLGYTKSVEIMEQLERRGIVGPAKGAEPREILMAVKPA
jgi:hypothetical protein